jgi:hypothetical protein
MPANFKGAWVVACNGVAVHAASRAPLNMLLEPMTDLPTIRELIERTIELSWCHAIWWELVNRKNFDRYEQLIQNHEDYFAATTHSLFQSVAIDLPRFLGPAGT